MPDKGKGQLEFKGILVPGDLFLQNPKMPAQDLRCLPTNLLS
jgi:hypothetical protein